MTNLDPLKAVIKILADVGLDSVKAYGDSGAAAKLGDFSNVLPDVMALIPQISQVSIAGLQPEDYVSLAEQLVADLAISNQHAQNIVNASLKLIQDMIPDVEALIAAIKG